MLNIKKMSVVVNNVTEGSAKYVVARVCQGELWYYGRYETEERAYEVAEEVDGLVLEDK